jgi:FAD/FMN-containing dehydrogenase
MTDRDTTEAMRALVRDARAVVGDAHVLTDPDSTAGYAVDWTQRWQGATPAVVRPGSTAEVAELVRAARRHRVALVPQGGNTGLVGGGVPLAGEAVVSLRRLTALEPVDQLAGQVTAGAGVTLAALQDHARAAGWRFAVDLGARDSASVGGMVATNAGGLHVVRHGAMRAQLVGTEAVLGTGEVVSRLSGLVKDNTGYDLTQLLCGSEGTLGIVTRARLRLVPPNDEVVAALLAVPSIAAAVELAAALRVSLAPLVEALELMAGDSLRLVASQHGTKPPVEPEAGAFLLVEVAGTRDPTEALHAALVEQPASLLLDAAVATSRPERERLWRLREAHSEAVGLLAAEQGGVVHKLDVTLPTAALAAFCDHVVARVTGGWPGATVLLFGHVGDGNVHVNVLRPDGHGAAADHRLDDAVLQLVVDHGGSISAEHGIGVAKRRWLARNRTPAEVEAMRAIKAALDPDHVLNPNALLP